MKRIAWAILAALVLTSGCGYPGGGGLGNVVLPVKTLYGSGQCGGLDQPVVIWIASPEAWQQRYGQVMSLRTEPPPPPAVDFPRAGVLLMAMGSRPSSGYGLSLTDEFATVRDGVLMVRVDWREPLPGYRQAQVMSSPCLLALLPDALFNRIQVLDQEGRLRLEGIR
ncbi:MAG: protease complex subunit PrcB family protein [Candidatus Competibacteraceae bacterium]|nr:protease complex subunit PrcB family protein [Candidatus Competibacteraceae bacterium]